MQEFESSAWSGRRRIAVITGVWCYFAVLLTVNNYVYPAMMSRPVTWRTAARFSLITYALWTVVTPLILFFCERIRCLGMKAGAWIAAHSVFAVFILLLIAAAWMPLTPAAHGSTEALRFSWHSLSILFWRSVAWNLWMYWVTVGIFYGLDYYFGARDAKFRAAQLESQLAKAELEVLKSQLQPHFLFNTLNLISSLVHTDQASADDMIGDLGSLLRMSLESHAGQEVPLAEEMKAIELYLNIQRLRFQDTLTVETRIAANTMDICVPHLILQPLVENAFRHGISKRVGPGLLRIESSRANGTLMVRITDNGPGSSGGNGQRDRGEVTPPSIGLKNTRARLERLYGSRAALRCAGSPTGFSVELEFPVMSDVKVRNG